MIQQIIEKAFAKEFAKALGDSEEGSVRHFGPALVVLDKGFIYRSNQVSQEGDFLVMKDAVCIRYFCAGDEGGPSGLGRIALTDAPLKDDKIDKAGDLWIPMDAVKVITEAVEWSL